MAGPAYGRRTIVGFSGIESAYGTAATVDRFLPITGETLRRVPNVVNSNAFQGGGRNLRAGSSRKLTGHSGAGDVSFEVATTGFGRRFRQILGGAPTITSPATGVHQHVYAMDSLLDVAETFEKSFYDEAGTLIEAFRLLGGKTTKAEFSLGSNALLALKETKDFQQVLSGITPAPFSGIPQDPYTSRQVVLLVGGTPAAEVGSLTLTIENPSRTDRYPLGNDGKKAQPVSNDFPKVTGQLGDVDFVDGFLLAEFEDDTPLDLVVTLTGGEIGTSGVDFSLAFSIPEIRVGGETPAAENAGLVRRTIPFEGFMDAALDPGATITYVTSDAAS